MFRFVDGVARPGPTSSAISHQDRNVNLHPGLVKQAYSAWVAPDPRVKPQKWHLTAYFTYADLHNLPTIDRDPILCKIIVPVNIYRSGKARSRNEEEGRYSVIDSNLLPERALPSLPSLQATVGVVTPLAHPRTHGMRLPEDQRVIQMLNSRPILWLLTCDWILTRPLNQPMIDGSDFVYLFWGELLWSAFLSDDVDFRPRCTRSYCIFRWFINSNVHFVFNSDKNLQIRPGRLTHRLWRKYLLVCDLETKRRFPKNTTFNVPIAFWRMTWHWMQESSQVAGRIAI